MATEVATLDLAEPTRDNMTLKKIRLELARTADAPEGDPRCGYEFIAPLDVKGQLDARAWPTEKSKCTVRRFWTNQDDEHGMLVHSRGGRWLFSYRPGEDDDEPIFRFTNHAFVVGEYVSITEHDDVERPFRVTAVSRIFEPALRES
jgi:hypothetical protein